MDLNQVRPRGDHEAMLASELALTADTGSCLILGDPPPALLLGAAASCVSLTVHTTAGRGREIRRLVETFTPVTAVVARKDGEGLPDLDEVFLTALIWELPRRNAEEALERALFAVGDGGLILISVERRGGYQRLERLTRSLCGGKVDVPSHHPCERLVLRGRRRAPYPYDPVGTTPEPLPVSVVVTACGRPHLLEDLLCDLLLRQHYPPQEVIVVDRAANGTGAVPPDLFGLAARSPVRTMLISAREGRAAAAANEALGLVQGTYVALLEEADRIAPNHLASLGLALEGHPAWTAVTCDSVSLDEEGRILQHRCARSLDSDRPLRGLLEGCPAARPAALFRTESLRRLRGLDDSLEILFRHDLWLRLAAEGPIGVWPIPLAGVRSLAALPGDGLRQKLHEREARQLLGAFRERVPLARLAREFLEVPKEEREAAALVFRGLALLRAGLPEESGDDLRRALRQVPGYPPAEETELLLLRSQGRHQEALARARAITGRRPGEVGAHLAEAMALHALGRQAEGQQRVDELLQRHPDVEAAHLCRLLLAAGGGPALQSALRGYLACRQQAKALAHADHLLLGPLPGLEDSEN